LVPLQIVWLGQIFDLLLPIALGLPVLRDIRASCTSFRHPGIGIKAEVGCLSKLSGSSCELLVAATLGLLPFVTLAHPAHRLPISPPGRFKLATET